jgi:hypothetical protein
MEAASHVLCLSCWGPPAEVRAAHSSFQENTLGQAGHPPLSESA